MTEWKLGVIGGSGLYEIEALENRCWVSMATPWGPPSDDLLMGEMDGVGVVFLPRHGRGHRLPPGDINARANISALKQAGCTDILSISAVGSLREDLAPGALAVVGQYVDRTARRPGTFFGPGLTAHVSMAEPTCPRLSGLAVEAARDLSMAVAEDVTYLAMEGPQFSTRAESRIYRGLGCDVIGMTAMPEARLAREAELPYANVCLVTDYDAWRESEAPVEVAAVLDVMRRNAETARRLLVDVIRRLPRSRAASPIDTCLDHAVVTDPVAWDPEAVARLMAVSPRRFGHQGRKSPV
ncbi:MAG: S-methyl-5'-thioadenosine phosphorylase [Phenylobacterium sp.]|uniref:S-methyl-5'-thioadenosine phosphorylase n=1 Tax=Phenylobacterium sp. TaxID=1871053 RepID=UPI0025CC22F4|nr:S-methyl-5'-thioadenosine phosphorylase [Phenylobacterium sp.]MBI1196267.1 S-methyl-5'-thioadenosine phosphorylase [Phenylobacterium sp.]